MRWSLAGWQFFALAMAYAAAAVGLELALGSRGHVVLLAVQYAVLLPCAIAAVRCARGGTAEIADVDRRVVIAAAIAVGLATIVIARFWDRGILWGDEAAYRVQAQIFAQGRPWTEAPAGVAPAELHFVHLIVHHGHWFTKYPPLWPAVLAVGDALHARWVVNPILAALVLWIVHRIARRELGLPTARLAVLVVLVSPYFFMMAASQMSHMLGLACCAGAALAFLHGVRTRRVAALAAALAAIGVCAFVRPFTAFCAAVALAPWCCTPRVRGLLPRLVPIAAVLGAGVVAAYALYNHLYTGHYAQSPYALYRGTELPVELSLSPAVIGANLVRGARWAIQDTMAFTWPLMFALAGYAVWVDRSSSTRFLAWFFAVFAAANLFHTEGSSSRFGDRYLFEALFAPALLAARGAALAIERLGPGRRTTNLVACALTVAGAIQAAAMIRPILDEIRPYVLVHAAVDALPDDGSLVYFPVTDAFTGDRFDLNAPAWWAAPHAFLVDPGPARRAAVAAALGRARWIVVGYDGGPVVLASGTASRPRD